MIPADFIQTLLSRVDIVEVVDRFVPLRKAGANYQACCPFHSEKTPSFTVSPTKQFYHCFGCGAHGTAVGFLMEHAGKTFPEAVEDLARDVGLSVPREIRPGETEARQAEADLSGLLLAAAKFYRARLRDAPQAIAYLKDRGLTGAVAARFGIGYAPDAWQPLAAAVPDYATEALEQAGLVIKGDAGKRYDRFRDRIMFPIHDARGRVIGFGGRVLGSGEPKYLNSPETPLFSKGRELYGLYLARNAIRAAGRVVVVEGYMDVVALAQHGIEYAVATLGTSTTTTHAQKLFRLADSVVFCFDGDAAGRKAAWRALEVSLPVLADGKLVSFLFLPPEDDPDTFVRREGREAFAAAVEAARPLSQFLYAELTSQVDLATDEGRARLVTLARPLLSQVTAPALGALLRSRLSELARLPAEALGLGPAAPSGSPSSSRPSRPAPERKVRVRHRPADRLLAILLRAPEVATRIPEEILENLDDGGTLAAVDHFFAEDPQRTAGQAIAYFEATDHGEKIRQCLQDPLLNQADGPDLDWAAEVDGLVGQLLTGRDQRRAAELAERIGANVATADERAEYQRLFSALQTSRSGNPPAEERSDF